MSPNKTVPLRNVSNSRSPKRSYGLPADYARVIQPR